MLTFSIFDGRGLFWENLIPKFKTVQSKNLILGLIRLSEYKEFSGGVHFFCFRLDILVCVICFKKSKLFVEAKIWNLDIFEYVEIDDDFYFFSLDQKYLLWVNLVQKFKIVSLS